MPARYSSELSASGILNHEKSSRHQELSRGFYRIRTEESSAFGGSSSCGGFSTVAAVSPATTAKRVHSMKAINLCLVFCTVLAALVGLGYLVFDPLVKHIVLKKLVLTNSSDFIRIWEKPPIKPHLKIYFFNLTNAEAVFKGEAKPILKEVGPYTYHQTWIKENVEWYPNGTLSYQTRKIYNFVPELSVGDHSQDVMTTVNVPVLTAFYQKRDAGWFMATTLEGLIDSYGMKPWISKTVEEFVWGYEEPLLDWAKLTLPNPPPYNNFGFFAEKNNSAVLPTYTMFTGEGNPYNLSKIHGFNGEGSLKFWKEDRCNIVQGSDGATFNPYISKKETLWFFNDQLCRSLPLVFREEVQTKGNLPGYRFEPRSDVFMSPTSVPENECFCTDEKLCSALGDGMFGISTCQFGAPIVLSWPHFLGANDTYRNAVEGLKPIAEEHGFWFDVQPITGTTLSAKARLQINVAVFNSDTYEALGKVQDSVIPALWFEEGLDELGPELVSALSEAVILPPLYKNYVLCVLVGLIMSTGVIASVAFVRLCINSLRQSKLSRGRQMETENFADDQNEVRVALASENSNGKTFEIGDGQDDEESKTLTIKSIFKNPIVIPGLPASQYHQNVFSVIRENINDGHAGGPMGQPMLQDDDEETSPSVTADSSRATTASHSRNTSAGSVSTFSGEAAAPPPSSAQQQSVSVTEATSTVTSDDQRSPNIQTVSITNENVSPEVKEPSEPSKESSDLEDEEDDISEAEEESATLIGDSNSATSNSLRKNRRSKMSSGD